jgi:hypothetical protein
MNGGVLIQSFHDRSPKVGAPLLNNKIISTNGYVLFGSFAFSIMCIGWNIRYQCINIMSLCHDKYSWWNIIYSKIGDISSSRHPRASRSENRDVDGVHHSSFQKRFVRNIVEKKHQQPCKSKKNTVDTCRGHQRIL